MTIRLTLLASAFALLVTACGGDDDTTTTTVNTGPSVNAGMDESAEEGTTVQLSGVATDIDGDALSYSWSQVSGPTVTLSSTVIESPTFTAPDVDADSEVVLTLSVSDGAATTSDSVTITIIDSDTTTSLSDLAKDQVLAPGQTATLDSGAADTDIISWSQTGGTPVTLTDTASPTLDFTVPDVDAEEALTFQANVNGTISAYEVYVFLPASYDTDLGLTVVGDFTDRQGWQCDVNPGVPSATIADSGSFISISGNGIPDFAVGTFPNTGNPNTIAEQTVNYQVTTTPVKTDIATDMAEFGVFLTGNKLERDTAERYMGSGGGDYSYEAITTGIELGNSTGDDTQTAVSSNWLGTDCNNSHVQPTGSYHSHGLPVAYLRQLEKASPEDMLFAGYAADGFPMYLLYGYVDADDATSGLKTIEHSWELIDGVRPDGPGGAYDGTFRQDWEYVEGSGDTDRCGGRTGVTPEFPEGTYHYFITNDYPYIPRCVFGTPDPSFRSMAGGAGQ